MSSRTIESLVEESTNLIKKGIREINVVSQDTCNYGVDLYGSAAGGRHLMRLLKELEKLDVARIRLLYLYPLWLSEEFYEYMAASDKICNYIDMPLQHSNREVLRAMKRPGDTGRYLKELQKIRSIIPDVSLRSTFLVGFPGETEEQFQELVSFVRNAGLEWMGAFTYSKEEGTTAFELSTRVHHKTRERRKRELIQAYEETRYKQPSRVGKSELVLMEEKIDGTWIGRTQHQAPEVDGVTYVSLQSAQPGDYIPVTIKAEEGFDLLAKAYQ
ncbi:radical SAM protein [bacterium]|nr:radical SAM protein [bacterium]